MKFNWKTFSAIGLFLCVGDVFSMHGCVFNAHKDTGFNRLSEIKSGVKYNLCTNVANKRHEYAGNGKESVHRLQKESFRVVESPY